MGHPSQIGSEVAGDPRYARGSVPVKIGIPVWLIDQNVTLQSSAITLCVIDPSSKKRTPRFPLCSSATVHAHKLCDYRTDLCGSLPRHNRLKGGLQEITFLFPPTLPGAFPLLKVLFQYLGQALFGAISLAIPSWVDVHPT